MPSTVVLLGPAGSLWQLFAHTLTAHGGLAAAAATATALVLLTGLIAGAKAAARLLGLPLPRAARDHALRMRARRTAFLPQRDPDARGRSRPRAPSTGPAAASTPIG